MAKIELQAMVDQARDLVRAEQYDEAIATCRYILKAYPKYVQAYSALAEASLQQEKRDQAADLFKRVLSADPQQFIAYVGLGIIYDEEGLVDEALWQFERAFELAPANAQVRNALRRLYGQRDGISQERIKLNRAALGYLYADGGLYTEAANEFKAVLNQDPERVDIRLALAEALWRDGKRREAAQVSQEILNEMPHCLKANLLLGEIWLDSGLQDEGQTLLRRAQAIDPENRVAYTLFGEDSPVPPALIQLDEMTEADVKALVPVEAEGESQEWLAEFTQAAQRESQLATPSMGDMERESSAAQAEEMDLSERESLDEQEALADETLADELITLDQEVSFAQAMEQQDQPPAEAMAVEEAPADQEEEESPTIAALEAEFGALPETDLTELSEQERQALEASMPGEDASSEEIMAWLAQQRGEQGLPDLSALAQETVAEETPVQEASMEPEAAAMAEEGLAEEPETTESPSIAALESEFGVVPDISLGELDDSASLELELPDESASAAEIMAWLEEQRQPASEASTGDQAEPAAEQREVEALEEAEQTIQEPIWTDEEEGEEEASPTIASLEAEFGALPSMSLDELGFDQDVSALEASMPPESASPEEIMAWLRQQHSKAEPLPEIGMEQPDLSTESEAGPEPALSMANDLEEIGVPEPLVEAKPTAEQADSNVDETAEEPSAEPIEEPEAIPVQAIEITEIALETIDVTEPAPEAEPLEPIELETIDVAGPQAIEAEPVAEAATAEAAAATEATEEKAEPEEQAEPAETLLDEEPTTEAAAEETAAEAEPADVIASYVAQLTADPTNQAARLSLARACAKQGDWEMANEAYGELARSAPDLLGEVIADLEALTEGNAERLDLHQTLGDAYMEAGQLEKALAKYNWVLAQM